MRGQHVGEVAVVEARLAGRRAVHVAEVLGDVRVAVAGEQQALLAEVRGDRLGVPAGAEGAVDRHVAGLGPEELQELLEQDRRVREHHLVLAKSQARLR